MFQISILLVEINPFMKRVTQDPYYLLNVCVSAAGFGTQAAA